MYHMLLPGDFQHDLINYQHQVLCCYRSIHTMFKLKFTLQVLFFLVEILRNTLFQRQHKLGKVLLYEVFLSDIYFTLNALKNVVKLIAMYIDTYISVPVHFLNELFGMVA